MLGHAFNMRDWTEESFGQLVKTRHRFQHDDPPDLELEFVNLVVEVGHTERL